MKNKKLKNYLLLIQALLLTCVAMHVNAAADKEATSSIRFIIISKLQCCYTVKVIIAV